MQLRNLAEVVETFRLMQGSPLNVIFGKPWHFTHSYSERHVDFAAQSAGVYIYTEPVTPDWNVPLEQSPAAVWYIGKSDGALAGRVWAHVGAIRDPETGKECVPRFKYHEWAAQQSVPQSIRDSVANGNVVVYTIRIHLVGEPPGYAQALEKFLLASHFRNTASLPPLNRGL